MTQCCRLFLLKKVGMNSLTAAIRWAFFNELGWIKARPKLFKNENGQMMSGEKVKGPAIAICWGKEMNHAAFTADCTSLEAVAIVAEGGGFYEQNFFHWKFCGIQCTQSFCNSWFYQAGFLQGKQNKTKQKLWDTWQVFIYCCQFLPNLDPCL